MILDANNLTPERLEADLCIIGSGAAGISLAMQFTDENMRVLVLESGGWKPEPATQALYAGSVTDERLHSPPDRYRQRRFGGSTTIWGGRCMPLDAIDFEPRAYVPHSGWPFGPDELSPYYPAANSLCEAGDFQYSAAATFGAAGRPIIRGFDCRHFDTDGLERFSCPTDFGARYAQQLQAAANVQIVLHANVTSIQLRAQGDRVECLEVRTLSGRQFSARARAYVLAVGGLEVPRLLLASRDVHQFGIGNQYDQVGRYYMCHLAGTIGNLRISTPAAAVHHGYEISEEGIYCRRRFALRPEIQRSERLGNFIARLHHPRITDPAHRNAVLSLLCLARPLIPYEYAKRLHGTHSLRAHQWLQHVSNVLTGPAEAAGFAWQMLAHRKLAERKFPSIIVKSRANLFSIDFHAEQQPNPASRVELSDARDALGVPRIRIDWRYLPADVATVRGALALLAEDFRAAGIGDLQFDPGQVENEMLRYGAYGGHHIGTTRMGADPHTSVVDADCRVHGVANLYVAGASTFPTSSQANPTLTIVALALRLATHLRRALQPDRPVALAGQAAAAATQDATLATADLSGEQP